MHSPDKPVNLRACDAVAVAMEKHLRQMQSDGHGHLVIETQTDGISLAFGNLKVRAESYDIALVRLAGALLDDTSLGSPFLARLRSGNIRGLMHHD